jgi:pimeloyl-ACP methyl ester carboxylesterase
MWITNLDTRLHAVTTGDRTPTLVLVHGLGGTHRSWEKVVPFLQDDYRTCVPDLRGCGASERGTGVYELRLLADDLEAVVEALDDDVVLVGHSLGGVVVQLLLLRAPTRVRGAVLVSTSSRLNARATENWLRLAETVEKKGLSTSPQAQARGFSEPFASSHPELLERLAQEQAQFDAGVYVEQARAASAYDFDAQLAGVMTPVLVVQGTADRMTPVGGSVILSRALPNARLELIEGVGHNIPVECPQALAGLLLSFTREL